MMNEGWFSPPFPYLPCWWRCCPGRLEEERALTSSFIKPFVKPRMVVLWFVWSSVGNTVSGYSYPSALKSFNHSKCAFKWFLCALIHHKLLNGLNLTPDSTVRLVDHFQWEPFNMFCSLCIYFWLKSIAMGSPYKCALLDKSRREHAL